MEVLDDGRFITMEYISIIRCINICADIWLLVVWVLLGDSYGESLVAPITSSTRVVQWTQLYSSTFCYFLLSRIHPTLPYTSYSSVFLSFLP